MSILAWLQVHLVAFFQSLLGRITPLAQGFWASLRNWVVTAWLKDHAGLCLLVALGTMVLVGWVLLEFTRHHLLGWLLVAVGVGIPVAFLALALWGLRHFQM